MPSPPPLRGPVIPIPVPITPARPHPVAGPFIPPPTPALSSLTAEQLIAQIARHTDTTGTTSYTLGECLRELAQPRRYRDELRFASFEELLAARALPSRFTAHKLIAVVGTFTEPEVRQLGGVEKSFALMRWFKNQGGDPRRALQSSFRLLGRLAIDVSARDIIKALRGLLSPPKDATAAARRAGDRLGNALRRAGIAHRTRIHAHKGACISTHFDEAAASQLANALKRLRKLEKQLAKHA
jgi:hypothetical protein